jgi:hypothetical protein
MPLYLAGKCRAHAVGVAADGDNGMNRLAKKLLQVL